MGMNDESKTLLSVFSFVGILISFFLIGLEFAFVVGPILYRWNLIDDFSTIGTFLPIWRDVWETFFAESHGITSLLAYALLTLLLGFTLKPLATWTTRATGRVGLRLFPTLLNGIGLSGKLYDPISLKRGYAAFTDWLHHNREAKVAWEWEFFNYYLACGIAFNTLVLFLLLLCRYFYRFWVPHSTEWVKALIPVIVLFFITIYAATHAWARSQAQSEMYEFYADKINKDDTKKTSGDINP